MPESWQTLWTQNAHERDARLRFYEPTHTYFLDGSSEKVISCTAFLHAFFPHFNARETIRKMMASPNWYRSKYFGKTPAEIESGWSSSGQEASGLGTAMHLAIEQYLNGAMALIAPEVQTTQEWAYFLNFWKECGHDLEPYRLEWEVFSEEHRLCGSVDGVMRRKSDGKFVLYDWKRSKEIKNENAFDTGYPPVEHLPHANYWHYTLQLNIYRWILETHYGLEIADMYLVILHPNNKNYRRIRLNRLDDEVCDMLDCRKRALAEGGTESVCLPQPACAILDE